MTTARQLGLLIGKHGDLKDADREMSYEVEILDASMAYGTVRCFVTPTRGQGRVWVELASIKGVVLPSATA